MSCGLPRLSTTAGLAARRVGTLQYPDCRWIPDRPGPVVGAHVMPTPNELYDQAVDLRDRGDKPGAVAKLEEAVAADPTFAIGHGMLAKLFVDLAESDKAIAHAKKVVELEPDDTFSYTALSVVYQRCGKIPEAEHAKAIAYNKEMGLG